jgi:hypothetical protein
VCGAVFGVAAMAMDRRVSSRRGAGGAVFGLCFWGAFQAGARAASVPLSGRFPPRERLKVAVAFAALGAASSRAA